MKNDMSLFDSRSLLKQLREAYEALDEIFSDDSVDYQLKLKDLAERQITENEEWLGNAPYQPSQEKFRRQGMSRYLNDALNAEHLEKDVVDRAVRKCRDLKKILEDNITPYEMLPTEYKEIGAAASA